jgi:hypothetical protein
MEVFRRSMAELTSESANIVLDLINQNSLYRGQESKAAVEQFLKTKRELSAVPADQFDEWYWLNSDSFAARIRNTAIGTLLIDLSGDVDLDTAVRKFEAVMAPANYKRPTAIVTKGIIAQAEKTIVELGFENSLGRRHAVTDDITVNNVLFVNRDVKKKLGGVLSVLKEDVPENPKNFSKVAEISINDFISNVLPTASEIEVMLEGRHVPNMVSLIAPLRQRHQMHAQMEQQLLLGIQRRYCRLRYQSQRQRCRWLGYRRSACKYDVE